MKILKEGRLLAQCDSEVYNTIKVWLYFCFDFLGSALLAGFVYRLKANIAIASRGFSSTYDNITENGHLFKILSSKHES